MKPAGRYFLGEFYILHTDNVPLDARVNVYSSRTKKLMIEDYQDSHNCPYDMEIVEAYSWNPKTNLLRIWI